MLMLTLVFVDGSYGDKIWLLLIHILGHNLEKISKSDVP